MKFKEMTQLSAAERATKKKEFELELLKLNTQVATGTPPKNAGTVSRLKKDIARLTLIEHMSKDKAKEKKPLGENKKMPAKAKEASKTKPKTK